MRFHKYACLVPAMYVVLRHSRAAPHPPNNVDAETVTTNKGNDGGQPAFPRQYGCLDLLCLRRGDLLRGETHKSQKWLLFNVNEQVFDEGNMNLGP